ncbi:MAG: hypothetical protein AAFY60_04775, partial [Myxococcota bacterium]
GFFLGLAVTISVSVLAVFVVPSRPVGLLFGFIGGFFIWAGFQTWVYCSPSLRPVVIWSVPLLIATGGLNAWIYLGA